MMKNSGMSFGDMAPEDIFAMGIQKGLALVKDMGRNGDSELAHVNPEEKEMLEASGGSGTINPQTGLREYKYGGGGHGASNDSRDADRGGNDRDDGRQGGGRAGGVGHPQAGGGFSSDPGVRGGEGRGVASNPSSVGAGPVSSDMEAQKTQTQSSPPDDRSFGQRLADGLAAAVAGPSFGPPTGSDPGFLGAAVGMAPGIGWGMGLTRGLQAMGIPGEEKQPGELGTDEYAGDDGRILSPGRKPPQQGAPSAPQAPQYAWQRPGAAPSAPGGLNLDGGMTPLQQRTAVATGGTSGNAGIYRDPAVVEFYRNLALYDLTQPGGAPRADATVTPIERQFVEQLGGQPGQDLSSFLKALAGLQF